MKINVAQNKSTPPDHSNLALRKLETGYFRASALYGSASTSLQLLALILGTLTAFNLLPANATSILVGLAGFVSAAIQILGDRLKGSGERALRQMEVSDGLGESISPRYLADFQADAPRIVGWLGDTIDSEKPYYSSELSPSFNRVVANTYESAWWTTRLSRTMIALEIGRLAVTFAVAFFLLKSATSGNFSTVTASNLSALAEGMMVLILTHGPLRRLIGFIELNKVASQTVINAEEMIQSHQRMSELQVLFLLHEYQLARQTAPRVSRFVWRLRRKRLNFIWDDVNHTGLPQADPSDKQIS